MFSTVNRMHEGFTREATLYPFFTAVWLSSRRTVVCLSHNFWQTSKNIHWNSIFKCWISTSDVSSIRGPCSGDISRRALFLFFCRIKGELQFVLRMFFILFLLLWTIIGRFFSFLRLREWKLSKNKSATNLNYFLYIAVAESQESMWEHEKNIIPTENFFSS